MHSYKIQKKSSIFAFFKKNTNEKEGLKGNVVPLREGVKGGLRPLYSSVTNNLHILTASMFSVIGLNKL